MKKTKSLTTIAIFVTLALILTLVENMLLPLFSFMPYTSLGVRMGLANVIILLAIVLLPVRYCLAILTIKCLLAALFSGSPSMLMFSIPAGLLSFFVQYYLYHNFNQKLSLVLISIIGSIVHNTTQFAVASLLLKQNLFPMLLLCMFSVIVAGFFIGVLVELLNKYLKLTKNYLQ